MNTNELLDILGEAEIALLKALAAEPIDRRSIGHARVRVTHAIETLRPEVLSARDGSIANHEHEWRDTNSAKVRVCAKCGATETVHRACGEIPNTCTHPVLTSSPTTANRCTTCGAAVPFPQSREGKENASGE